MKTSILKKAIEEDPLSIIHALFEAYFWPTSLTTKEVYARFEDDSPEGALWISFSPDGDGWIQVIGKPDPNELSCTFRFRMPLVGGGQSPRVRVALLILAEAIRMNKKKTQKHRGG